MPAVFATKKVSFVASLVVEPKLHEPKLLCKEPWVPYKPPKNFLQKKKHESAAKVLQRFIRKNLRVWRYLNERETDLLEELEQIKVSRTADLERVAACTSSHIAELAAEAAAENEQSDEDEDEEDNLSQADLKKLIEREKEERKSLKKQIKELKASNKLLDKEGLRLELGILKPKEDIKRLEETRDRMTKSRDEYLDAIFDLFDRIDAVDDDRERTKYEAELYKDCVCKICSIIADRTKHVKNNPIFSKKGRKQRKCLV